MPALIKKFKDKTDFKALKEQGQFMAWLSTHFLLSKSKSIFQGTTWISFVGLILGVACLVVSMAVMSGFESTLKKSVADVTGHIRVRKNGVDSAGWSFAFQRMKELEPSIEEALPYAYLEGVLANRGKLAGVLYQGVDEKKVHQVLNLKPRLVQGTFDISGGEIPQVVIGKGLAQFFQLKPGDQFRVVFPLPSELDPSQFRRKIVAFKVAGILDLGKKEFDDRMVLGGIDVVQRLVDTERSSGLLLRIHDIDKARLMSSHLSRELGPGFVVSDWRDINENLFEAVQIERVVVFFVILIIIVAAAFNVSSSLYINVVKRYPDIGILRGLGFSEKKVIQLFSLQGMMLGLLGVVLGIVLGIILCGVFTWAETYFGFIPTSVYKLDKIDLNIRIIDLFSITFVTMLICFLATLAPALKGAKLTVVEGLRND